MLPPRESAWRPCLLMAPDRTRPPLLYLAHRMPYPLDKGDRIRNFHLLRFLARHFAVHLACLADEPAGEEAIAVLRNLCEQVGIVRVGRCGRWLRAAASLACGRSLTEGAFRSTALRKLLAGWARETRFAVCVASASSMVPYLRQEIADVPAVIDLVDVDSQKWLDYAAAGGLGAGLYRLEGDRLRSLERDLPSWARAVTLVSEAEAALYQRFCGTGTVRAIPNGVDLEYFRPQGEPAERACVFAGAMNYRPNVDAACWFCEAVWPKVRDHHAEARLYLVGRKPGWAVRRLRRLPGVEVVGTVPDVRPYLARAAAVVAPLRIARGMQNKVLEALAMGKAVVASPQCLAGVPATPGFHLLAAESPDDWVKAIDRLLRDADLRERLGRAGREYVEAHHRWDRCLEPFVELLVPRKDTGGSGEAALAKADRQFDLASVARPCGEDAP
jgi:sugar transferase (PEP-CTERM/EpsH1 system associated)